MSLWLVVKDNNSISRSTLPGRTVDKLASSSGNHNKQWNKSSLTVQAWSAVFSHHKSVSLIGVLSNTAGRQGGT